MKKLPDIGDFNHFAIIQTGFLGDAALALYLSQNIKTAAPHSRITFITTTAASPLISISKAVDNVIPYDKRNIDKGFKGINALSKKLRDLKIDCIISPHRSIRSTLVSKLSAAKYSVGFDKNAASFLYSKTVKYHIHLHETERNKYLLTAFAGTNNVVNTQNDVEFEMPDEDISYVNKLLSNYRSSQQNKIIALAPGSVWETKRWLPEYYIRLAKYLKQLGYNCICIGGESDRKLAEVIAGDSSTYSLAGQLSLTQSLYLLQKASLLITNDSAPTHLAGLAKCPTVTIYGATTAKFGFYPFGEYDVSIEPDNLKCHPCAIHGGRKCPIGEFYCMKSITPEYVLGVCLDMLGIIY